MQRNEHELAWGWVTTNRIQSVISLNWAGMSSHFSAIDPSQHSSGEMRFQVCDQVEQLFWRWWSDRESMTKRIGVCTMPNATSWKHFTKLMIESNYESFFVYQKMPKHHATRSIIYRNSNFITKFCFWGFRRVMSRYSGWGKLSDFVIGWTLPSFLSYFAFHVNELFLCENHKALWSANIDRYQ